MENFDSIKCEKCKTYVPVDEIVYNKDLNKGLCFYCTEELKEPDFSLIEQVFVNFKDIYSPNNEDYELDTETSI